jgi:hypothetical protein
MCCLKYEENAYEDLVKRAPKVDAFVETPSGKGTVISVNLLRGNAKVRLENGLDTTLKTFTFEELDVLGGKARRAEYITARAEGKLEEPKREAAAAPSPVKKQEVIQKAEPKFHKGHIGKPPAMQDKKQPDELEPSMIAGEKIQSKKNRRHHRGGKGRTKPSGQKPVGEPPAESASL